MLPVPWIFGSPCPTLPAPWLPQVASRNGPCNFDYLNWLIILHLGDAEVFGRCFWWGFGIGGLHRLTLIIFGFYLLYIFILYRSLYYTELYSDCY